MGRDKQKPSPVLSESLPAGRHAEVQLQLGSDGSKWQIRGHLILSRRSG